MPLGYYAVLNVSLNGTQKAQLVAALQNFGLHADPNPINNNHWRIRTDQNALIFHGNFDESEWSVASMKAWLGSIFGVPVSSIGHRTESRSYSEAGNTLVVTFTYLGTDRLQMIVFGGVGASRERGHLEALGYLKANAEAWGEGGQS